MRKRFALGAGGLTLLAGWAIALSGGSSTPRGVPFVIHGHSGAAVYTVACEAAPAQPTGTAKEGEVLTAVNCTWNHTTTLSYQWERCNSSGTSCAAIGGATSSTYTLASGDVGHKIRVYITGLGSNGVLAGLGESVATAEVTGGGSELKPNLSAENCFEPPVLEVEGEGTYGEGTKRITECGYATPENVGAEREGKKCSEKSEVNPGGTEGAVHYSKAGETIENKWIRSGAVIVEAANVTFKNDCITDNNVAEGEGSIFQVQEAASNLHVESSTLRGENNKQKGALEWIVSGSSPAPNGTLFKQDVFTNCGGGGGCIHLWGSHTNTFEVIESYLFLNACYSKTCQSAKSPHPEIFYNTQGKTTLKRDTLLLPEENEAIIFGETNSFHPEVDEMEMHVEENLIAGAGQQFETGKTVPEGHGEAVVYNKAYTFRYNRFARCLTGPEIPGGGKVLCSGSEWKGGDSHGYYPKGSSSGTLVSQKAITGTQAKEKEPVWEGNFWDNNGAEVKESEIE